MVKKYCKCGCGQEIKWTKFWKEKRGYLPNYIKGHHQKTKDKWTKTLRKNHSLKMKVAYKMRTEESIQKWKEIISLKSKEMWKNRTQEEIDKIRKGNSIKQKLAWKNKTIKEREQWIENVRLSLLRKPSSLEIYCIKLFKYYNISLMYCGDGKKYINGKNPDFINEEKKILIEVFAGVFKIWNYGSIEEYKLNRQKIFLNWNVYFFEEQEIYNNKFLDKIKVIVSG